MSSVIVSVGVVSYLNNMCRDMLKDVCARNGLDYEDECRKSGISEGIVVVSEEELVVKKVSAVVKGSVKKVVVEGVVSKSYKGSFPLPFVGVESKDCCGGLKHNEGLMTQCRVSRKGSDEYCKTCKNQADKNGTGMPTYGCIKGRMEADIYDYTAPNGEHVSTYSSVMLKYNLSEEMVLAEASKMNMVIDSRHFEKVEDVSVKRGRPKADKKEADISSTDGFSSKRGRPKKESKVIELEGDDLFASLVANQEVAVAIVEEPIVAIVAAIVSEVVVVPEVVKKVKKVVDKEAKKKEKEAKEQAIALKKQEEEAASKAEEEALKAILLKKEEVAEEVDDDEVDEVDEEEEAEKVSPITVDGKKYLKSSKSGVVYDFDSHEEVGEWNSKTNSIDFYEEEEEEYEEE